jgi:hypothetical protein
MAQMLVSTANWSSALVWSQCKEHILKQINKRFPKKIKINDNDNNNKKKTERWDYNMCSNNCHEIN